MVRYIRTHLGIKLFISYGVVVLVGVIVLVTATNISMPSAFDRHLAGMSAMMSGNNMMGNAQPLEIELFSNYKAAVTEALSLAAIAAMIAAVLASFLVSRQVVGPVQQMMKVSRRIAEGEYSERLKIPGDVVLNQFDELDQLTLTFNQMAEKLEKTEKMRSQLIGDVSHELRTPLAAIKGYMEGLMDGVLPGSPETYSLIHAEAGRLQRLVNDLQELSRVEDGAYQLNLESVAIPGLITKVVSHLKPQFEEKGLQLEERLEINLPNVSVDQDRITQVLINLIGNAIQFTPTGGKVVIGVNRDKSEMEISVTDTGIGISPDVLPMVFNRFFRTDKSRTRASGGSGIGLTIAQAIVRTHHGRIWVKSQGDGKGSSFHFTLPIMPNSN
jgi:histidine kinase